MEKDKKDTDNKTCSGSTCISKELNPAITPDIDRALVALADLTEFYKLGGDPGIDLSVMIEHGDAYFTADETRLRELVDARSTQLSRWMDIPVSKLASKGRKHRKLAKECLSVILEF